MTAEASATRKPGARAILLGLFVLFQLLYLPLSNFMRLVPRELPPQRGELDIRVQREGTATEIRPLQEGLNGLGTAIDRWGEFSGQVQAWSLFAPDFGTQTIFPIVECYCIDERNFTKVTLKPKIVPADPADYFRWPSSQSRLAAYEYLLIVAYRDVSEESLAQRGEEWRQAVRERVRTQRKTLEAYFRWNLMLFHTQYPDLPMPNEMLLSVLVWPSPMPGETHRPPAFAVPLARWVPKRVPDPGFLPIEAYDPVAKQFARLPVKEDGR